jgi:hypothetical protein
LSGFGAEGAKSGPRGTARPAHGGFLPHGFGSVLAALRHVGIPGARAAMRAVILSMAFLSSTRTDFLTGIVTLAVVLLADAARRRYGRPSESAAAGERRVSWPSDPS